MTYWAMWGGSSKTRAAYKGPHDIHHALFTKQDLHRCLLLWCWHAYDATEGKCIAHNCWHDASCRLSNKEYYHAANMTIWAVDMHAASSQHSLVPVACIARHQLWAIRPKHANAGAWRPATLPQTPAVQDRSSMDIILSALSV